MRWPSRYAPGTAPVHVRNTIEVGAPVEAVWAWLIRAQHWPDWYVNASNVEFLDGTGPDLSSGARFKWTTFGVRLESTVREFVPRERIAWDARGIGVDAYHAWVLSPTANGTHVVTEETQHGWLARLSHLVMTGRMHKYHQIWLEGLRAKSEQPLPGA